MWVIYDMRVHLLASHMLSYSITTVSLGLHLSHTLHPKEKEISLKYLNVLNTSFALRFHDLLKNLFEHASSSV